MSEVWVAEIIYSSKAIVLGYWEEKPTEEDVKEIYFESRMTYFKDSFNDPDYHITKKIVKEICEKNLENCEIFITKFELLKRKK